jgi:hypothetical protein
MDDVADGLTIVVALRHFSKRFAEGKGGLSYDELARATGFGSDALTHSLSLLASENLITSAVTDEHMSGRRLFYLTRPVIERSLVNRYI